MKDATRDGAAAPGQDVDQVDVAPPDNDEVVDVLDEKHLIAEASAGFETEKELSPAEAVKAYRPAIGWALVMALCVIMEGYDTSLLGNFYAYPAFQIKFGKFVGVTSSTPSGYQLTAAWQSGLGQSTNVGGFFGVLLTGYLASHYGQRIVIIWSLVFVEAFIFLQFFAPNLIVLTVGEFLLGIPWATLATCSIAYASEVLPASIRTYMTSYTNMCFIIGQLISAGVLKGFSGHNSQWAYRIPFAIQWIWPVILIPLVYLAPESPWHLARMGRFEEAEQSLKRLQSKTATNVSTANTLATIIHTNNYEERNKIGTSYLDCFKGPELRRAEIACMTFASQAMIGIQFAYSSTYFFQSVGVGTSTSYSLNLGGTCMGLFACFINWFFIMPYVGRRTIFLWGVAGLTTCLLLIGILNVWTDQKSVALAQAVLCLVWTFIFEATLGQLGWSFPAEISSTRLRQKTICVARNFTEVINITCGILQQYMINPTAWNVKGYVGFVWGGTGVLLFIWTYFRLPEVWNRPYEELDILFTRKISARKFAKTKVDIMQESHEVLENDDEKATATHVAE